MYSPILTMIQPGNETLTGYKVVPFAVKYEDPGPTPKESANLTFQIDTVDTFDSGNLRSYTYGGVPHNETRGLAYTFEDGTYYWRATATNANGSTTTATREFTVEAIPTRRWLCNVENIVKGEYGNQYLLRRALYQHADIAKSADIWCRSLYQLENVAKRDEDIATRALYSYENITDDPPFPYIFGFNKYHAAQGDTIRIFGAGFGYKAASDPSNEDRYQRGYGGKVDINGLECGIISWSWTEIVAQIPSTAESGVVKVILTTPSPTPGYRESNLVGFVVTLPVETPGIGMQFKVANANNPQYTVAFLDAARGKVFQKVLSNVGAGKFEISRTDLKGGDAELLKEGNIIRCQLDGVDKFAWIIETRKPKYVEASQQEMIEISGRGALSLLDRAIVYPEGYPNHESLERVWTDSTAAAILKELIDEAQARGTIPEVTYDFTDTHDSNGIPFGDITSLTLHSGADLLTVAENLTARGVFDIEMDSELTVRLYLKQGIDLSDEIIYEPGNGVLEHENITDSTSIRNSLIVEGDNELFTEVSDTLSQEKWGRREGYLMARNVNVQGMLADYGNASLKNQKDGDWAIQLKVDDYPYRVLFDFQIGDYVTSKVPPTDIDTEGFQEKVRVAGITISDTDTEVIEIQLDLNTMLHEAQIKMKQRLDRLSNNSTDTVLTSDSNEAKQPIGNYLNMDSALNKGDTLVNDGDSWKRLAVGTNGQMPVADDTEELGIKWQDTAAGPHAANHATGGDDEVTPESIGAETPAGAQTKAETEAGAAETAANAYTDTEIAALDKGDVGLGYVENYGIASKAEAEAGTANDKYMTPLRTAEAIEEQGGGAAGVTSLKAEGENDLTGDVVLEAGNNVTLNQNDGEKKITISATGEGGSSTFTELSDTPPDYAGQEGKYVRVNAEGTGLDFTDAPEGGGTALPLHSGGLFLFSTEGKLLMGGI